MSRIWESNRKLISRAGSRVQLHVKNPEPLKCVPQEKVTAPDPSSDLRVMLIRKGATVTTWDTSSIFDFAIKSHLTWQGNGLFLWVLSVGSWNVLRVRNTCFLHFQFHFDGNITFVELIRLIGEFFRRSRPLLKNAQKMVFFSRLLEIIIIAFIFN